MPTALRRENKSVIQRLLDEPQRFEFAQAVNLLLRSLADHGIPREKALREHLKFDNSLSLSFPATEIEKLKVTGDGVVQTESELVDALAGQLPLQIHITPAFMGFLGASGALPLHYTERIRDHQVTHKDEAPRAFLDIFANRTLSLFYEAWCKYRVESDMGRGDDIFLPMLTALTGFRANREGASIGLDCDRLIAHYAGVIGQRPLAGAVLERVLSSYFGVPFEVDECVGQWTEKEQHEQTSLGAFNTSLGRNAMLGATTWRPDLYARLTIGPLAKSEYDDFLPGARGAQVLRQMLALLGEQTITYVVVPILCAADVPPMQLGGAAMTGARLGLDCFLVAGPSEGDRADLRYQVKPMAPLPPRRPCARTA